MNIDINQFSEAELVELNQKIVERLRFFHQMRAHASMLNFSIGDRVAFDTDDGRTVTGTLVRYNKRSVSIIADDQHRWNVSPSYLRLAEPKDITPTYTPNIGTLSPKK